MIADDETSSSSSVGVPPPFHRGPQSRSSSVMASNPTERQSPKRPRPLNQTIVAVRICPLRSSEKASGQKCCIRSSILPTTKPDPTCAQASAGGNNKKQILSPSASNQTPSSTGSRPPPLQRMVSSPSNQNKKSLESEENSRASVICDTENKMRFDFDHVIGPGMSQELCYHQTVGRDVIQGNLKRGADTTVVVLGHKKCGKAYTMTGGWNVERKAGEHSHSTTSHANLSSNAGILPRAVHHLFEACHSLSGVYKSTVSMSFYMVATEGGRTRDLLMRFRDKESGEAGKGITFVPVKSPQGVKRLMDRVSKKRVSDVKDGRKFHVFSSFRVVLACHDQVDIDSGEQKAFSSTLTFISLRTPPNLKTGFPARKPADDSNYNLRDLLHGVSAPNCSKLFRRLDDVLLGAASIILIGCISPLESEMEPSTDLLHLLAKARKTTYSLKEEMDICDRDDRSKNALSKGCPELRPTPLSITDLSRVLSSLHNTLYQAEQAAKSAQESSNSLETAATRCRSHRRMLTRETTLAAIAQMKNLTVSKTEEKSRISLPSKSMEESGRTSRRIITKSGKKENSRQTVRHGPRLIREKEEMKSSIERLKSESRRKDKMIDSLKEELANVNTQLSEEREINKNLEDIRSILKRKAMLHEERLEVLERKVAASLKFSACIQSEVCDMEKAQVIGKDDNLSTAAENNHNACPKETDDLQQDVKFTRTVKDNLLSIVDDSFGEDSVYLAADDIASLDSTPSTTRRLSRMDTTGTNADFLPLQGEMHLDTCASTDDFVHSGLGEVSIHTNSLGQSPNCKCQNSLLASGYAEKIEFYLPKLNIACLCGKQQRLLGYCTELGSLDSILQPWQAEFLASIGIVETEKFLDAYSNLEHKLPGLLMKWRAANRLEAMPKQSCATALLVWSRSCSVALRKRKCNEMNY